jgi:hypothetical protein
MSVRECRFVTLTSGSATLFHTQRHATVTVVCRPRNSHWSASRTCKQLSLVRVRDDTQVRHEPVCRPRNSLCFTQHSRCVWRCTQLSLVSVTNLHATLTGQRHEPVCRPRNSLCFTHNSRCVCGAAATTQQSLVRGAAAGHERERETERESLCVYQKRFVVKGGKTSKKFALDNPLVNLESVISFGFVGLSCSF